MQMEVVLEKERKVANRREKELARGGTKFFSAPITVANQADLAEFQDKILCGDSELVLKSIPSDSIDIIVTSPPYNFGLDYDGSTDRDALHWSAYFEKLNAIWMQCKRVLKPGGRICINVQPLFSDYIPTHHIVSKQLLDLGLLWKGEILWEKNNYNCKYTAWGSWKSPSMPYLKYTWEFIEVFSKDSHKKAGDREKADISGEEFKKWVYAKWSIAPERQMKDFGHPAMFPEEIPNRLLKLFSYQGDVVLDPFNGVGTTTLVAKKLKRHYIGMDISKAYCEKAEARITDFEKQTRLL